MVRTIYHITGCPDGTKTAEGKAVGIVYLKLGKITKRSDGRYQAVYRDLQGIRKFITCRTEEEVVERFRALQPTVACDVTPKCGQPMACGEPLPRETALLHSFLPDERMLLASYTLNWLETYKRGKIRPSSFERYRFCLQLLCKDEIAHMDVRSIRLEDIQMYVNRLDALSASTIKKQKLLLSQVLEARATQYVDPLYTYVAKIKRSFLPDVTAMPWE